MLEHAATDFDLRIEPVNERSCAREWIADSELEPDGTVRARYRCSIERCGLERGSLAGRDSIATANGQANDRADAQADARTGCAV